MWKKPKVHTQYSFLPFKLLINMFFCGNHYLCTHLNVNQALISQDNQSLPYNHKHYLRLLKKCNNTITKIYA